MQRLTTLLLAAIFLTSIGQRASADVRPLLPGEATIYETVNPAHSSLTAAQVAASDRQFFSQITGNANREEADEILLDKGNFVGDNPGGIPRANHRFITNIAIGTQTFKQAGTYEYTPAFLECTIYLNDGPPDTAADGGGFPEAGDNGAMLMPGTVLYKSRIPGPTYPHGGVGRNDANVNDFVINFPFPNVLVPPSALDKITVSIANLDPNGNPDITWGVDPVTRQTIADPSAPGTVYPQPGGIQQTSFRFGTWHDTFVLGTPAGAVVQAGDLENNENVGAGAGANISIGNPAIYNTNIYGTSRTGANINRFTNNGHWIWINYNGKNPNPTLSWESGTGTNSGMEMTIYAAAVPIPEPASIVLAGMGLGGVLAPGVRRRRAA